jgi:hypothetical protein
MEKETNSYRLSSLGKALAMLCALLPSAHQTQLLAISNMLLTSVSEKPAEGKEQAYDRKLLAEVCAELPIEDLAEVLKYPFSKAWIPQLIAAAGPEVAETYIDFFTATIRNRNTRQAYARACWQFFDWCAAHGLELTTVRPFHVSAWIEDFPGSKPTVKQKLAAVRMLCRRPHTQGARNPSTSPPGTDRCRRVIGMFLPPSPHRFPRDCETPPECSPT